jgi:hypothetical protein
MALMFNKTHSFIGFEGVADDTHIISIAVVTYIADPNIVKNELPPLPPLPPNAPLRNITKVANFTAPIPWAMSRSVAVAISICSVLVLIGLVFLIVALVLYCKYNCCKKKETPTGDDSARELLDLEKNIGIQTDLIDEDAYN